MRLDFNILVSTVVRKSIDILNADGSVYQNLNTMDSSLNIDITTLPVGLYFIRAVDMDNGTVSLEKILKMN